MSDIHLSVIVPAYNEASRLPASLEKITAFLSSQPYTSEILVVDDGSKDETCELAEKLLKNFPHRVLKNPGNRGKGYSVRSGMLEASGKYLLFTDADLSTPIEEAEKFLKYLESNCDVVIGSRAVDRSQVKVRQNFLRETMGKVFNLFARLLTFRGVKDSQCGFKAFKKNAARDLFSRQTLEGFGFDVEIVYLTQKLGYKMLETPVVWRNSAQSKVNIVSDSLNMFLDLIRIRWAHRSLKK